MTDFEAMSVYDAGEDDILNTLSKFSRDYPSMNYSKGSMEYLTYTSGASNKFHNFFLAQDGSGNYFAFNGYARIGYGPTIHRIAGPTSEEMARGAMRKKMRQKERKGYVNRTRDFKSSMRAEYVVTESGLPVIPDSYGTNSALDSGQGVPVWYGSAEGDDKANSARKLVEMLGSGKIEVNSIDNFVQNFTRDTDFHELSEDELDIIFRDGSMATMIADKTADGYEISTVVVAYDSEHHKGQGYNDEMDESLGMRHRGSHSQSFKDRRDEASAMDRRHSKMGRKYDDVMAMDSEHHKGQGYNDEMDESLGMRHRGSHSQSFKDRRDEASAMDKKYGMMRKYDDVAAMDAEDYVVLESGLPVIPDSYGTNSALDSGQGVPVWYGSAEGDYDYQSTMGDIDSAPFTEGTVNPMTFTRLGAYDFPVIDNSEGQDSAIGGRGVPEWYGSAEDEGGFMDDFDRSEYEYKDVELVKPFKTGFMGALGVIMAPVAVTFGAALLGMFLNRGE
jgi:predicted DNA-binding WGR domain protein